jgi:hypothetical protein
MGIMTQAIATRDTVFVAGGQPSITYVQREELQIERKLARALAAPNHIVSLAGPTKSGKTVLCRRLLEDRQYVWIDGGQVKDIAALWDRVAYILNYPIEIKKTLGDKTDGKASGSVPLFITVETSRLSSTESSRTYKIDSMATAIRHLTENNIVLVIDDFHYLNEELRLEFLRNIKGAVFNGLKPLLLSVSHRAFDAIKAESELTGRFTAIAVPEWTPNDLEKIPFQGFAALNVSCGETFIEKLAEEAQQSPFLIQKFCWEICYDLGVTNKAAQIVQVPNDFPVKEMFVRIAQDAGLPIYQKLVAGPQARKERLKRPLRRGGEADVYEATLLAIAETGPKSEIVYEEIRSKLNSVLADKIPQKHEVTSALKHLSKISSGAGTDQGMDWDDNKRMLHITDPYFKFFLRWQVRHTSTSAFELDGEDA